MTTDVFIKPGTSRTILAYNLKKRQKDRLPYGDSFAFTDHMADIREEKKKLQNKFSKESLNEAMNDYLSSHIK